MIETRNCHIQIFIPTGVVCRIAFERTSSAKGDPFSKNITIFNHIPVGEHRKIFLKIKILSTKKN